MMSTKSDCDHVLIPLEQATVTPRSICSTCERFCHKLGSTLHAALNEWDNSENADVASTKCGQSFKFPYHQNLASLGDLARTRCHLCTLHWFNIHPDLLVDLFDGPALTVEVSLTGPPKNVGQKLLTVTATLNVTSGAVQLSSDHIPIAIGIQKKDSTFSFDDDDIDIPGYNKIDTPVSRYARQKRSFFTGSEISMDLTKSWLDKCIEVHNSCRQTRTLQLPTRLIDISSGTKKLFIHSTSGAQEQQNVEYVALSHCWGDAQFLKLRMTNFFELRDGFSIDELPRTWREAIAVARYLGFKYIWIDALCIIQDSSYDWSLESPLMGSVYGNCSLNLAALDGESSDEGLFSLRNPILHTLLYTGCDLSNAVRSGMVPSAFTVVHAVCHEVNLESSGDRLWRTSRGQGRIRYLDAMREGPLNKRGWVLQERAFSPRTLYFGKAGIFWDCRESELDETKLLKLRNVHQAQSKGSESVNIKKSLHRILINTDLLHPLGSERMIPDAWYDLLNLYCPAILTFENDRLGAISGLAKLIRSQTKSQYYAGLWYLTLLDDLLWAVPKPVPLQDGISTTVPGNLSFSWASLGAPSSISWPHRQLKSGIVAVLYEGQALSAHCKSAYPRDHARNEDQGQDDTDVLLSSATTGEIRISCKVRKIQEGVLPGDHSDHPGPHYFNYLRDKTYPKESTTHFATLRQTMTRDNRYLDFGLVLHKAEKGYKRVGMFYEAYGSDQAAKWDTEFKLHAQKEHATGDPQGRTTILLT